MRFAARKEMAYLGAIRGRNAEDRDLVQELGRRLDALRRYDQYFCDADWQPRSRISLGRRRRKSAD
jgi:hypothetical protein